ncbi:MAG: pyridoxal phosphate-dependent aminotransferase, partial [Spirochaetia bacterium]
MRRQITHSGSGQLRYMIREIVQFARQVQALGRPMVWENIGDPVRKGEAPPDWMKSIVSELAAEDLSFAYSDTQGVPETREFLAERANKRLHPVQAAAVNSGSTVDEQGVGPRISADDIVFFNGLGDAVSKIFGQLRPQARVIGPSPAYSTHSSAEAAHSGYEHLTYRLDPERGWLPDLEELERSVRYNPSIAGILIINPDNPTGAVYPREVLEGFVDIARRHDLFIICDETYAHVVYGNAQETHLNQIIGDVPGLAMRSISKELPWPGARCGWIEVYNRQSDPDFAGYIESIIAAKRLEVCSTTLPQLVIPRVMADERYETHLNVRNERYERRAAEGHDALGAVDGLQVNRPRGGFFITPVFSPGALPGDGSLPIADPAIRELVEKKVEGASPDARFVYYLIGARGVCVVPLSGFCSELEGFRMTLLES